MNDSKRSVRILWCEEALHRSRLSVVGMIVKLSGTLYETDFLMPERHVGKRAGTRSVSS